MSAKNTAQLVADANVAANDSVEGAKLAKKFADEAARDRRKVEELTPDPQKEVIAELARAEGGALLRIGPRRNRWRDLQQFDDELAEIELQRSELDRQITEREADRNNEPARHAAALASWYEHGQQGKRPQPNTADLGAQITDLEAERAALGIRYERLLTERAEHVAKSRKRMAGDVAKAKEEAEREYRALVDQLEAKRQEVLELRATEVWVSIYPSPTLTSEPNTAALVGAKKHLQESHLPGLQSGLVASAVFSLLRADVGFCSSVATAEQAAAERGVSVGELTGREARWLGSEKADFVGPEFPATWGGSEEEKVQAGRVAAYTEAMRRTVWGDT